MLGWWIVIAPDNGQGEPAKEAALARWETGVGGRCWLDDLVAKGKAQNLRSDGYPCRYTAKAADVLPLIKSDAVKPISDGTMVFGLDEGEEYSYPVGWMGEIKFDDDLIASTPADQLLIIDAWDQS